MSTPLRSVLYNYLPFSQKKSLYSTGILYNLFKDYSGNNATVAPVRFLLSVPAVAPNAWIAA